MTGRTYNLPPETGHFRTVGPFDEHSLPDGLRREHRLKAGSWGLITLEAGEVTFVWDDEAGGEQLLIAPTTHIVPPTIPHHLCGVGPFRLTIEFFRSSVSAELSK